MKQTTKVLCISFLSIAMLLSNASPLYAEETDLTITDETAEEITELENGSAQKEDNQELSNETQADNPDSKMSEESEQRDEIQAEIIEHEQSAAENTHEIDGPAPQNTIDISPEESKEAVEKAKAEMEATAEALSAAETNLANAKQRLSNAEEAMAAAYNDGVNELSDNAEYQAAAEKAMQSENILQAAAEKTMHDAEKVVSAKTELEKTKKIKEEKVAVYNEKAENLNDAVQALEDAKKAFEDAVSTKDTASANIEANQKAIEDAKAAYDQAVASKESLENELEQVKSEIADFDQNIEDARAALAEAQKTYEDGKKQVGLGSIGFFYEREGESGAAKTIDEMLENGVANAIQSGLTGSGLTNLYTETDATSLENMKLAISYMYECNELRASDDHNAERDKTPLMVSDVMMLGAQIDANAASEKYKHWFLADGQGNAQILANMYWNQDPYDAWYTKEKASYEKGNTGNAGHYKIIANPDNSNMYHYTVTGLAVNSANYDESTQAPYRTWMQNFASRTTLNAATYSLEDYDAALTEYYNRVTGSMANAEASYKEAKEAYWNAIIANTGMTDDEKVTLKSDAEALVSQSETISEIQTRLDQQNFRKNCAEKAIADALSEVESATSYFNESYDDLTDEQKEAYATYRKLVDEAKDWYAYVVTITDYNEYMEAYAKWQEMVQNYGNIESENGLNGVCSAYAALTSANNMLERSTAFADQNTIDTQAVIDELNAAKATLDNLMDKYETSLMASGATAEQKETILQLKEDIKNSVAAISAAEEALKQAESETDELNEALTEAETAVADADTAVTDAGTAVTDAEGDVATAKSELDTAETAVTEAETGVTDAETALKNAQDAEDAARQEHEADVANVEETVKRLSRIYNEAVTEVDAAEENVRQMNEALEDARAAYNTAVLQYNEAVKTDEEVKADKTAADKVVNAISLLNKELTLNDKEAVEYIRSEYNHLTETQKVYVTNLEVLTAAEKRIIELEKADTDQKAAAAVDKMINDIQCADVLQMEEMIITAEEAFEALSDDQKMLVRNYEILHQWRIKLEKAYVDKAFADEVVAEIALLNKELTLEDSDTVKAARNAYDELTEDQKVYVSNLSILTDAENQIKNLETLVENQKMADTVNDLIKQLPLIDELTVDDKDTISKTRKAYEDLTEDQKKLVTDYKALIDLEEKLEELLNVADKVWVKNVKHQLVKEYTGSAVKLTDYEVYYGKQLLKEGTDYKVTYTNNKNAGTAQMIITLKGSYAKYYEGRTVIEFTIRPVDLSIDDRITVDDITAKYTNQNQTAKPMVYFNGKKLPAGKNYQVTQPVMKEAGSYTVVINGLGPNFTGTKEITYTIIAPEASELISKASVKVPAVTAMSTSEDLKEMFKEGKAVVKDGKKILTYEEDYTIECDELFDTAGTGYVLIKGTEKVSAVTGKAYYGEKRVSFKVTGTKITAGMAVLEYASAEYTGSPLTPKVTMNGLTEADYEVKYTNNTNAGTATVLITGKGSYTGTVKKTFRITKADVSKVLKAECPQTAEYTAGGSKPAVTVTDTRTGQVLKEGIDYKLTYSNNKAATLSSSAKAPAVKVTGLGNYQKSLTVNFDIVKADMKGMTISAPDTAYANKKGNWQTALKVLDGNGKVLSAKTDYTVEYTCDSEVLTASSIVEEGAVITVKVTGKGKYDETTSITAEYRVIPKADVKNISAVKVTVSPAEYTGSALTPEVTVQTKDGTVLVEGTDYEIAGYSNNTAPGKNALVILKGIGNWSGTKVQKFTIRKASDGTWWSNVINALPF